MSDDSANAEIQKSKSITTEEVRQRLKFVTDFYVAIKNSRIFDAGNIASVQSIKNLFGSIRKIIENDDACVLKVMHNYLVLNDKRLKGELAMRDCYSFMIVELKRVKIRSVSFAGNITEGDLGQFIFMLGGFKARTGDPFEEFSLEMEANDLRGIELETGDVIEEEVVNEEVRKRSADVYFESISLAREIITRAQAGRAINFRRTRRLVQNIIDVAMEEDYFLMSLTAIKNHDEYTFNHSANVCVTCVGFGKKVGLSKVALEGLGVGALLHDVGKIVIPREVLNKPGKLTDEEWAMIRRHPAMGVKCLLKSHVKSELLLHAIMAAFEHHQGFDMSGYPEVKDGRKQNLMSEIIQIADVYDALTTPRVYRKMAMKPPEALRIMTQSSGGSFNPELLKLFIASVGLYPVGSLVELDTGEVGMVYSVNQQPQYIDRPLIKIISDPKGKLDKKTIDLTQIDETTGKFVHSIVDCFTPSEYFKDADNYAEML